MKIDHSNIEKMYYNLREDDMSVLMSFIIVLITVIDVFARHS